MKRARSIKIRMATAALILLICVCTPLLHCRNTHTANHFASNLSPWLVHTTNSAKTSPLAQLVQKSGQINMGVLVARMGGVDGVALETEKINRVFVRSGLDVNYLVGEGYIRTPGIKSTAVDELLAFAEPVNMAIIALSFPELTSRQKIKQALELALEHADEFGLDQKHVSRLATKMQTVGPDLENHQFVDELNGVVDKMIQHQSNKVLKVLENWVEQTGVKTILIENSNTIPMQIPLGVATAMLAQKRPDLLFINHNHDFYWERHRYTAHMNTVIDKYLDLAFPLTGPNVKQMIINSAAIRSLTSQTIRIMQKAVKNSKLGTKAQYDLLALTQLAIDETKNGKTLSKQTQQAFEKTFSTIPSALALELAKRMQVLSTLPTVLPNVMDFDEPSPVLDDYNSDLRINLGLSENDFLIGNIVRIVERKSIEITLKMIWNIKNIYLRKATHLRSRGLVAQANRMREKAKGIKLLLSGGDENIEGDAYLGDLKSYIIRLGLTENVIFLGEVPGITAGFERGIDEKGRKKYTFDDIYANLDMVSYPSTYEGFGNAFLEAVWSKVPLIVYPYKIYREDIRRFFPETVVEYPQIPNAGFWREYGIDLDLLKHEDLQAILEFSHQRNWLLRQSKKNRTAIIRLRKQIRDYFQSKSTKTLTGKEVFELEQILTNYGKKFYALSASMSQDIDRYMRLQNRTSQIRNEEPVQQAFQSGALNFSFNTLDRTMAKLIEQAMEKDELKPQVQNSTRLAQSA